MNRKVKRVLLVGTVVLGISTMIPHEASAQLFRGRGAAQNGCPPVCCPPTYNQVTHQGHFGGARGWATL